MISYKEITLSGTVTSTIAHNTRSNDIPTRKEIPYFFSNYGFNIKTGIKAMSAEPGLSFHTSHNTGLGKLACQHQSIT